MFLEEILDCIEYAMISHHEYGGSSVKNVVSRRKTPTYYQIEFDPAKLLDRLRANKSEFANKLISETFYYGVNKRIVKDIDDVVKELKLKISNIKNDYKNCYINENEFKEYLTDLKDMIEKTQELVETFFLKSVGSYEKEEYYRIIIDAIDESKDKEVENLRKLYSTKVINELEYYYRLTNLALKTKLPTNLIYSPIYILGYIKAVFK